MHFVFRSLLNRSIQDLSEQGASRTEESTSTVNSVPLTHHDEFYKSASQRAMWAKGRAMPVMRVMRAMQATVKMLRIFICYNYICMRTRTRAMEQDEYNRSIKFLQRLHKPLSKRVLNQPMRARKEKQNMMIKIIILNSRSGFTNRHQDVFLNQKYYLN